MHLCFIFSICPRMAATSCSLKTPYHIYNRLIIDKRNLIIGILCSYIHLRPNHINNIVKMKTMESSIFGLFGDAGLYSIKKPPDNRFGGFETLSYLRLSVCFRCHIGIESIASIDFFLKFVCKLFSYFWVAFYKHLVAVFCIDVICYRNRRSLTI